MKLRMTIEVELNDEIILPKSLEDVKRFENDILRPEDGLILNHPYFETIVGVVTKIETIDYLEHEVKE